MSIKSYNADLIQLEGITILSAAIDNKAGVSNLNQHAVDVNFAIRTAVNLQNKRLKVDFDCTLDAKSDNGNSNITSKFEISYIFHIENLDEMARPVGDLVDVDEELRAGLSNIVYATSRGIIYTRCLGTVMGNMILPVLSTSKLLTPVSEQNG